MAPNFESAPHLPFARLISAGVMLVAATASAKANDRAPETLDEASAASAASAPALAHEAKSSTARDAADGDRRYLDRFWLVDPRARPNRPEPDLMKLEIHGEYQVRYSAAPDVPLSTYGFSDYGSKLGQSQRLEHRLRFTPQFQYRESLRVVSQFDVPHGMLLGEPTDHVTADPEPMTSNQPMGAAFRWLYADVRTAGGQLTLGQQPARWGLGLLYDSGDERQLFGDSRLGTIVERVAYLGKPFGPSSPLELLLATDWVFSDARARWLDGDRDLRSMVGFRYAPHPEQHLGVLVVGEKFQPKFATAELSAQRPTETTVTVDFEGRATFAVPGQAAYVIAEGESAIVLGRTDVGPEVLAPHRSRVRRFGGIARLGAISMRGSGQRRWGKWGVMFEWGFASGDADPSDGVDHRFVSNPSRRVGLILFDEVLRWKWARAQSALDDARVGQRPLASASRMATAGGVAGATYLSMAWLFRPAPNLDVRLAALLAQTTADLVDPARLLLAGRWGNFDGGASAHRDLGAELDLASEFRQPLANGLGLSLGAEAGLLLPGRALADAGGALMRPQGLLRGRFGFYF